MSCKKKIPISQIKYRNENPEAVQKALIRRTAPIANTPVWSEDEKLFDFLDDSIDAELDAQEFCKKRGADSEW